MIALFVYSSSLLNNSTALIKILGMWCMNIVRVRGEDGNVVHLLLGIRFQLVEKMSRGSLFGSMLVLRK